MTRTRRWRALAIALTGLAVVAACSSPAPAPTVPARVPAASEPPPPASPLTGLPADPGAPVVAVKIDNSVRGRPWDGVENADVVYVEPVEGGLTRLLAVFASRLPTSVGPVRSARESDVDILSAYGQPALVYSGAAAEIADTVSGAPVVSTVPRDAPGAFRRNDGRPAPANLYTDLRALLDETPEAAPARDIGFRFGPAPPGGAPANRREVRFGATRVGLAWDERTRRWTVAMDGARAVFGPRRAPIQAATVIVQRVRTRDSVVTDAAGSVSPFAVTVGSGDVEILRDGKAFSGRWSRPSPDAPTRFADRGGAELRLAPGPVWVLLAPPR